MRNKYLFLFFLLSVSSLPVVYAAHWIVGYVEDALDGTSPNDREVKLWSPTLGSDVITSIIGPNGPSLSSHVFMIDCELLNTSCAVGDNVSIALVDDGSGFVGLNTVHVVVTGAGFDVASNLSMNAAPNISNVSLDDAYTGVPNEIDLTPATNTSVLCSGIVEEFQGIANLTNVTGQLFSADSFFDDADDNNLHYTNNSCLRDDSFGHENETLINCSFQVTYYANAGSWSCTLKATDWFNASSNRSSSSTINSLLALWVNDSANYSLVSANAVSAERILQIINYGNVRINLSVSGFGNVSGDGNAMNCDGGNITIAHQKYNLSSSNAQGMNFSVFNTLYKNLTADASVQPLRLNNRQDDNINDAINNTYWRIYVPSSIGTTCQGNIVIGATQT